MLSNGNVCRYAEARKILVTASTAAELLDAMETFQVAGSSIVAAAALASDDTVEEQSDDGKDT